MLGCGLHLHSSVQLIVNLKPAVLIIALLPQIKQISPLHQAIFFSIMLIYIYFNCLMMEKKCFVYDHACLARLYIRK